MTPEPPPNPYEAPHSETPTLLQQRPKGLGVVAIWLLTGAGLFVATLLAGVIMSAGRFDSPALGLIANGAVLLWGSWTLVKPRWQGTGLRIAMVLGVAVLFVISYIAIFWATCFAIFAVSRR